MKFYMNEPKEMVGEEQEEEADTLTESEGEE